MVFYPDTGRTPLRSRRCWSQLKRSTRRADPRKKSARSTAECFRFWKLSYRQAPADRRRGRGGWSAGDAAQHLLARLARRHSKATHP